MIKTATLRPGLLVSIKTAIKGNVEYVKIEGPTTIAEDGAEHTEWETKRTVQIPAEQAEAVKVRGDARALVIKICAQTEFGLLCPNDKKPELEKAFVEARALCEAFNATSKVTKIQFGVLAGYIEPSDAEAVRAIQGDIREMLDEMRDGLKELDVERVRNAASRASRMSTMLTDNVQAEIKSVLTKVRATARQIVKAGTQAAAVVDEAILERIAEARTMFLDFETADVQIPEDLSGRNLDLEDLM